MARAYASTVVPASADEVWALLRDFNSLPSWLPVASSSEIEDGKAGDQVSAVRVLGEHRIRERLVTMSDRDRCFSYTMPEPIFPIKNHLATMRVTPVTDAGHALVEWSATFDAQWNQVEHWEQYMSHEVFAPGLTALKQRWTEPAAVAG